MKMSITIIKAERSDLQAILNLQYLAYQSEATLFWSKNITPLRQTPTEQEKEYDKGIILKVLTENNVIIGSIRVYEDTTTVYIGKFTRKPCKTRSFRTGI